MFRTMLLVVLVGCGGGPAGDGAVWVDATGKVVPVVEYMGEPAYVDNDDNVWALDPWTGTLGPWGVDGPIVTGATTSATSPVTPSAALVFLDDACTEPAYRRVDAPHPPLVVMLGELQGEDRLFVVVPEAEPSRAVYYSHSQSGDCDAGEESLLILVSDTVKVAPPTLDWVFPVHPEWE